MFNYDPLKYYEDELDKDYWAQQKGYEDYEDYCLQMIDDKADELHELRRLEENLEL